MSTVSVPSTLNLEQQRAQYAWICVQNGTTRDYANLSKAAPALIMNNGLLPALAFYQQKKKEPHYAKLFDDVANWLRQRSLVEENVLESLVKARPEKYRKATEEAFALLRWIRQFAAAVQQRTDNASEER